MAIGLRKMLDLLKKLESILTVQERRRFLRLVVALLVMGLVQVVGLFSILPFMQLVVNPEMIEQNKWLLWLYQRFGFQDQKSFIFAVGTATLVLLATSNFTLALTQWLQQKFVWDTSHALAKRLLMTYVYQPYEFFLKHDTSKLGKQILAEVRALTSSALLPLVQLVSKLVISLAILFLLVAVNPKLATIVFLVLGTVYYLIYFCIRKSLRTLGGARFEANQMRFKAANEALGSIKIIKTKRRETYFIERFSRASKKITTIMPKYQVISQTPRYFVETVAFGGILLIVLYLLASNVVLQAIIPLLSLYALAAYRLLPSLQGIFSSFSALGYSAPTVESIHNDFATAMPIDRAALTNDDSSLRFEKEITICNLSFKYEGSNQAVLSHIDLTIPKNKSVAFVGPTGSGKTTLVDILIGLLRPTSGYVLIDGVPLTLRNARSWQAVVGYVPQDVTLYDETVTLNIAFGVQDFEIDLHRARRAAKTANVHDFITNELPNGYETVIGERGVRLSGGQRQRIGLARALYDDPQVLILDEATSALDGITEDAVMDGIRFAGKEMSLIIIAHRLTTVRECDHIYLMDRGLIVAEGSYYDLMEANSMFRGMAKVAS